MHSKASKRRNMTAVLLADGFEMIEALTPVDVLRRAGVEVYTVGMNGKTAKSSHGVSVICDITVEELDISSVENVIFPGGLPGASNLDASPYTDKIIASVCQRGGRLAAICAAPLILGRRGLLSGKRATCYPGFESELKGAILSSDGVVSDGSVTTARGMGVSLKFAEELVSLLLGSDAADRISNAIMEEK